MENALEKKPPLEGNPVNKNKNIFKKKFQIFYNTY